MKKILFFTALLIAGLNGFSQKLITKDGVIHIFSETSLFTIEAENAKVASILNMETGEIVASTLERSFKFKEALVEEHFNENYMESHKYPKATLKGKVENIKDVNLSKNGDYPVTITGDLSIHGKTNAIKEKAVLKVKDGKVTGEATFNVSLEKYGIMVEKSYKDRIKDDIELKIKFVYEAMKE